MKKKTVLLVALMSVCATLLLIAGVTFAANAEPVGGDCGMNVKWSLDEDSGELRIYGEGEMDEYDTYPWYEYVNEIETLSIEDGVTSISNGAFCFYYGLTSVTISETVTNIGEYAFYSCQHLKTVTIDSSDVVQNEEMLQNSNLIDYADTLFINSAITDIPDFITTNFCYTNTVVHNGANYAVYCYIARGSFGTLQWTLYPDTGELRIYGEGAMEDGSTPWPWYSYNNQIKSITIEYGVTSIGDHAFSLSKGLESVTIPESVTSIGKEAFDYCEKLSEITIPNSVTTIGDSAFQGCTNLSNVTMPERMMNLGLGAFESCSNLTNITIPDGITSIEVATFQSCWNLTNVTIPDSVTSIGDSAFLDCHSLTNIIIPDGVTSIGREAFRGCNNATSIALPGSVTSIGLYAFSRCSGLEKLTVAESNPKYLALGNCLIEKESGTLIQGFNDSSKIPVDGSVTSIGDYAFRYCEKLTNITIPNGVTSIGDFAFADCHDLTDITISKSVTSIGDCAFWYCEKLTNITIPDNVKSIGSGAFEDCYSFTDIILPDGITTISDHMFADCFNLTNITIPDSVTSIGDYAFCGVDRMNYTNIIIPNNVTSIGRCAFADANLTEITIPASVTSIGEMAFDCCYYLKTVYIDSPTVTLNAENEDEYGDMCWILSDSGLIDYADTVYINSAITEISDYITTNFPYTHTAVHDGTAYTAYSKTPTVHDTLEGYIQFRPGDGVYDARVLVEGKSDFMADYTTATVTLTFTKSGDSNKTLTMTALADQAYTSVMACGQKKDARPGYGFIGLVVTGIGNDDVGSISASVTLTMADGDTFTYELGRVDNVPDYVGHPIA